MCYPVLLFLWLSLWGLALVAGAESLHRWTHPHHPRLNISGWLTPLLHFNAVDVELGQRLHAVLLRHHTALKNLLWLAETALFLDDAPCRRLSGPPDARAAPLCLSPELLGAETERLPRSAIWTPEFQRGLAAEEARLAALSARIVRYMQRPAPGQPHLPYVIIPLFRAVAEHVCDRYHYGHGTAPNAQGCRLRGADVQEGSVVFVNHWNMEWFLKKQLPHIRRRFLLVAHGSDKPNPGKEGAPLLRANRVLRWFGQNVLDDHLDRAYLTANRRALKPQFAEVLRAVPLGLDIQRPQGAAFFRSAVANCSDEPHTVPLFIGMTTTPTDSRRNPYVLRAQIVRQVEKTTGVRNTPVRGAAAFGCALRRARFVLSPPGKGYDCHRTWVAMHVGAIPIILSKRAMNVIYEDMPVWIVQGWGEVTHEGLEAAWERMRDGKYNMDKLWAPWWLLYMLRESLKALEGLK